MITPEMQMVFAVYDNGARSDENPFKIRRPGHMVRKEYHDMEIGEMRPIHVPDHPEYKLEIMRIK